MQKTYFYKTPITTPLGQGLTAFMERCVEADKAAQEYASNCGAHEYLESPLGMAGGVALLVAPLYSKRGIPTTADPSIWKQVQVEGVGLCYEPNVPDDFDPAKAAKRDPETDPLTIAEQLEIERVNLPVVTESTLIAFLQPKPVKLKNGHIAPTVMTTTPRLFRNGDDWFVSVPFACKAKHLTKVTSTLFNDKLHQVSSGGSNS